jgi:hypothetical protein
MTPEGVRVPTPWGLADLVCSYALKSASANRDLSCCRRARPLDRLRLFRFAQRSRTLYGSAEGS